MAAAVLQTVRLMSRNAKAAPNGGTPLCMLHPALRLAFAALEVFAFYGHRAGAAAPPCIYKPFAWTVLGGIAAVKLSGMPCRMGTPREACAWAPLPASAVILHSYCMGCPLQPGMPEAPHIY